MSGKTQVVDTTTSTGAANTDIFKDKTAYVNGSLVTGKVAAGANVTGTVLAMPIPAGLYSGSTTATASNTNLLDTNIKKNVTIFGVLGTYGESAPVPRTGQTQTVPLSPAPVDSDGNLQKGVIWPSSSSEPPSARFKSNSANTVTDNLTGLMWAKNANLGTATWAGALTYCNDLTIDTYTDWRLPNRFELESLLDLAYYGPALSNDAGIGQWVSGAGSSFTGVQTNAYWSSTTYANDVSWAWYMLPSNGYLTYADKSGSYFMWPVRGGQ